MTVSTERFTAVFSDRYRIERELGRGGMATVYLAHDIRHDRKVAIKVLHAELAAVLGGERFLTEIKTTASLQHPHILPLFDSGQIDSELFYVMPFVDGESLRDRLAREKQLSLDDALRIAREVADALGYAHSRGVIHRDIKPENILLQGGHALVADFGIALAVQHAGGERMTQTGLSLGTPQYMSPEQAMGEKTVDRRSDLYSLGAVLYEMLAGEPPFVAATGQALIAKILTDEPRPLIELRKSIPSHVDAATRQALEKVPADRFDTAAEFLAALANPAFVRAGGGRPAASIAVASAATWRVAAVGLGAVALVLAAALTMLLLRVRRDDERHRGVLRVGVYLPENQLPRDEQSGGAVFSVLPDGSGFVYAGPGVVAGAETQLWLRRWNELNATPIAGTAGAEYSALSPDGKSVAFLAFPLQLKVVSLTGGLATVLADSGVYDFHGMGAGLAWGNDGVLYLSGTSGLIKISSTGGREQRVSASDAARGDEAYLFPDLLPNGKGALVAILPKNHKTEDQAIGVVNFATGVTSPVFKGVMARYLRPGHIVYAQASGALMAAPFDEDRLAVTGPSVPLADTAAYFAVTRGGDLIYAKTSPISNHVVSVDRNGIERETWSGLTGAYHKTPRLSPDGRRLAISIDRGDGSTLWIARADGGPMTRLSFDGSMNERAAWTPDGQRVTFPSDHAGGIRLFERRADGSGPMTPVNVFDARRIFGTEWAPRGDWLLFRTDDQAAGNADIMGIRPGIDSAARSFVATPAEELAPAISPDGRWLAYSSDQSGRREVFVRPFPETDRATYQVSTAGGTEPLWSRDGRELFFRDERNRIVSVPVAASTIFERGAARELFDASNYEGLRVQRNYDVTPDGQRFVMLRRDAARANRIVAVFGLVDELRVKGAK